MIKNILYNILTPLTVIKKVIHVILLGKKFTPFPSNKYEDFHIDKKSVKAMPTSMEKIYWKNLREYNEKEHAYTEEIISKVG